MALFRKNSKNDFTRDMLPKNRTEVFFDVLKVRFGTVLRLGLMLLLFSLPMLLLILSTNLQISGIITNQGETIASEAYRQIYGIYNTSNLLAIALLPVFACGLAGTLRVTKLLIWGEGISFSQDFLLGIRKNGKELAILFGVAGIVNFLNDLIYRMTYVNPEISGFQNLILLFPRVFSLVFLFPVACFVASQIIIYTDSFRVRIRNAIVFYLKTAPKTLVILFLSTLPFFMLRLIGSFPLLIVFMVLLVLLVLPLTSIVWMLFSCSVFDEQINKNQFPEILNKGIWRAGK